MHQPLGKWLYPSHKQRMKWAAYTSANTESVYIRKPGGYQVYYLIGVQTTSSPPCMESELPEDAIPVDMDDCSPGWRVSPTSTQLPPLAPLSRPLLFTEYIASLPEWDKQLFDDLTIDTDVFTLADILSSNIFTAASNGSVIANSYAAFGWVLSIADTQVASCSGPVYGYKPTSYRAEGYGMFSFLRFLPPLNKE